ncbi:hypothetical protein [Burkholderia sp. PU8-34]
MPERGCLQSVEARTRTSGTDVRKLTLERLQSARTGAVANAPTMPHCGNATTFRPFVAPSPRLPGHRAFQCVESIPP